MTILAGLAYFSELTDFILSVIWYFLFYAPLFILLFFIAFVHKLVTGSVQMRNTSI